MNEHTPEPWQEYGRNVECLVSSPPQARISWDDWQRARCCVNACQSIPTEALEADVVKDLLEAAKAVLKAFPEVIPRTFNLTGKNCHNALDQLAEALHRAEGGE